MVTSFEMVANWMPLRGGAAVPYPFVRKSAYDAIRLPDD